MLEQLSWNELKDLATHGRENVEIELKEDRFPNLSKCAREIHETVVAMLNSCHRGYVVLGVEDGTLKPTGTDRDIIDLGASVKSLIKPQFIVYPYELDAEGQRIIVFPVPEQVHGAGWVTCEGNYLVRGPHGNEPAAPNLRQIELISRGLHDYSSNVILAESPDELLDPAAVLQFRHNLETSTRREPLDFRDKNDLEMLEEVELVEKREGRYLLTVAGGLMVGNRAFFRRYLPCAEINYLRYTDNRGVEYSARREFRGAIVFVFPQLMDTITTNNEIYRVMIGEKLREYQKLPPRVVQEALANAIVHRTYACNDGITIRHYPDRLVITNPGGFVKGISPETILNATSRLRNRLLAEVMQRVELVQRSGQGVKRIFHDLLSSARPEPVYRETGTGEDQEVELTINTVFDESFMKLLVQMESMSGEPFDVYELLVLHYLNLHHRVAIAEVERLINRDTDFSAETLERLQAKGMLVRTDSEFFITDPDGNFDRRYPIFRAVLGSWLADGRVVTKRQILELLNVDESIYRPLMEQLKSEGLIEQTGEKKGARYHWRTA